MRGRYPITSFQELGSSPRLGGRRDGPNTATVPIWNGRPPTLENQAGSFPRILSLAAQTTGVIGPATATSVDIQAVCGNAFGGQMRRDFTIGEGLSADLACGSFRHVRVVTNSPIPVNTTLFFCWVDDLPGSSGTTRGLTNFMDYPVAGVRTAIPEGAFMMYPESACQITFTMVSEGATFVRGALAGEAIPVMWGTFSCNVVNKFVFRLRSF